MKSVQIWSLFLVHIFLYLDWIQRFTPWCSGYHYWTTSINKASTQVLRRFKSCLWHVGDSQWWGSLTMTPAGNKSPFISQPYCKNNSSSSHFSCSEVFIVSLSTMFLSVVLLFIFQLLSWWNSVPTFPRVSFERWAKDVFQGIHKDHVVLINNITVPHG